MRKLCWEDMARLSKNQTRVALVTGGAKRVGRAIVERLAAAGFDVAFTYRGSDREANQLVASLKKKRRCALAISVDLTLAESASQVAQQFSSTFNRLDLLVNSASLYEPSSLSKTNPEQLSRLWMIHVATPMMLCQHLAPLLRKNHGHVVNMVDLLAEKPWPEYLAYCTSKAGLVNLTLGLARELAPQVTVNGIAPGVVGWPKNYPRAEQEKYLKRVPLGRAGTPNDVANLVHFLATDGAYITGQIIRLDGGRSIV